MKTVSYKHYIEILPATLLSQQQLWQKRAGSLPSGTCLLVTNPDNPIQTKFMVKLARLFREKGNPVTLWTVGRG